MAAPDVSVCVVSYECRDLLEACLASLPRAAPEHELEIIVADNASGDGTPEMLAAEFPTVRVLPQETNLGFAAAMNRAVAASSAPLIAWLNPDCEVQPGAFAVLIRELQGDPDLDVVAPKLLYPRGQTQLSCGTLPRLRDALYDNLGLSVLFPHSRVLNGHRLGHWSYDESRDVAWASGACLMMRREAWEQVGPLDERFFMYCEETDWFMRLHKIGGRLRFVPDAVVMHHHGAITDKVDPTQTALWGHRSKFLLFRKHYGRGAEWALRLVTLKGSALRLALSCLGWLVAPETRRIEARRIRLLGAVCKACMSRA
jgi:hypothetical protein